VFHNLAIALALLAAYGICTLIYHLSNFHWLPCSSFLIAAGLPRLGAEPQGWPKAGAWRSSPASLSSATLRTHPAATRLDPSHTSYRATLLPCKEKSGKDKHILLPFFLSFVFFSAPSMHIGKEKKI